MDLQMNLLRVSDIVYMLELLNNKVSCNLLYSKSRVAPLKQITLLRLELCACLLLSRLLKQVTLALNEKINEIHLNFDSMIALHWIHGQSTNWKLFVANRVSEIQQLTSNAKWHHIESPSNPADILSRGCLPEKLINFALWWHGPSWLLQDSSCWPTNHHFNSTEKNIDPQFLVEKRQTVQSEINGLQNQRFTSKQSKLSSLDPFLDGKGLLRVGGRLEHSNLPFDKKHRLILHPHANITRLIIHSEHLRLLHAGLQLTHSSLRQRFWIVNAKIAIRSIVRKCLKCFRFNADKQSQQLGQLPSSRITPSRAFSSCAIDYGSPIMIRHGGQKSKILSKAYIALFICLVTKAIHLELVSDLTKSFNAALRRFIARRGICNQTNLCEGDLVLICDDNTSPLFWKSGIVTHAFMGSDNLVRVVDIRTSNGVFRRPIHKLCLLPLSDK
ncbi:uncharacterized protein LOC142329520 [Lycorma delicatula]|uniref:uncharacterized protein LOC142329520 n=1 Tax=Lycorma delicatula TaxID=130591 RepID=UPI003F5121A4